jgi:uncharacterized protein YecT (DUF1311 family)
MNDIIIFLLGTVVAAPVGYLAKRYFEKAHTSEEIDRVAELVDIRRKLDEGSLTMADIVELRSEIMRQSVEAKIDSDHGDDQANDDDDDDSEAEEGTLDMMARARENIMTELDAGDLPGLVDGPQQTMNRGQAERLQRANAILRRTIDRLRDELSGDTASLLKLDRSQRAWRRYRDEASEFSSLVWAGGTMQPFSQSGAATVLTIDRIVSLRLELWNRGARV